MARALAEPTRNATDWRGAFERLEAERSGREPQWLARARREALEAFLRRGFPSAREEAWRYTNPAPIARTRFVPSTAAPRPEIGRDALPELADDAARLVFVDGRFAPELSSLEAGTARVASLAQVIEREPALVEERLARASDFTHPFEALNAALFVDGAFVHVPRGLALERPIHVVHVLTPRAEPLAVFPRSLVVVEERAQATLVERVVGPSQGGVLCAPVTAIQLAEGARLDRYALDEPGEAAFVVAKARARLGRAAFLRSHQLVFGAAIARTELDVELAGEGAECELAGLYALAGERRAECRTFVDHALPHGTSRQDYRGVLAGRSRGAFAGEVLVRQDAQKSDARQHNRNLVLSREATADTKPELRIHADDVKCAHGATIGRLDEAQVFYLRSRGIDEREARRALTRAFASAVLAGVRPPELRARAEALLDARLETAL